MININDTSVSYTDSEKAHLITLATDAFIWGFPRVVTQRTMQMLSRHMQVNRLYNQKALSSATSRAIVAPNQDTLYSIAILDLRNGPVVLTIPDVMDRYWSYQFLDSWTESFHYLGTRATGGFGGKFLITPPNYLRGIPEGMQHIDAPTPQLVLLGRYLIYGEDDIPNLVALSRTLELFDKVAGDNRLRPPPNLGRPAGKPQNVGSDGAAFFNELGDALLIGGAASEHEKQELARFVALGIGPGLYPATETASLDNAILKAGVEAGLKQIANTISHAQLVNGWSTSINLGAYGANFLLRARTASVGWGANIAKETIYASSRVDSSGNQYDAQKHYVIHFNVSQIPPVDCNFGFWSITLYGTDMFFVENSIGRYAIGDRSPGLVFNHDGSLDLFIQHKAPIGQENNWLPTPFAGTFILVLRMYLPTGDIGDEAYQVPGVTSCS